jgi:uncharacterized damage-inducible protein DinB
MRLYLTILFSSFFVLLNAQEQDPFIADYLSKWQNAMEYTLEFAEAMPAESYDFQPMKDERAFHEQLTHLCGNMIWLSTSYLGGEGLASADTEKPPTSKDEVIKLLRESFEYTAKTIAAFDMTEIDKEVEFFAGPMSKRKVFFLIADHVTHHRGQLVVYLRLKDIKPPGYRGW